MLPSFKLIYFFSTLLPIISAATHWVVTEDGRIAPQVNEYEFIFKQSYLNITLTYLRTHHETCFTYQYLQYFIQMDSVYQLEKPHDLMALLNQEDRTARSELLREELFLKKVEFEHKEDKDAGILIEEKIYATDPDCLKVGRKVTTMAIFESTYSTFESYNIDLHKEMSDALPGTREPDCSSQLDFSMQTFEHLIGIQQRSSLVMGPEISLQQKVLEGMDLKTFGNWIGYNIEKNASWVSYDLATLYYRIVGNAQLALDCCRLALYYSPREYRSIALVNLGNILTHSHQQEDGIIVLHAAVDHSPTDPIAQYTLANGYALIGDLNR